MVASAGDWETAPKNHASECSRTESAAFIR